MNTNMNLVLVLVVSSFFAGCFRADRREGEYDRYKSSLLDTSVDTATPMDTSVPEDTGFVEEDPDFYVEELECGSVLVTGFFVDQVIPPTEVRVVDQDGVVTSWNTADPIEDVPCLAEGTYQLLMGNLDLEEELSGLVLEGDQQIIHPYETVTISALTLQFKVINFNAHVSGTWWCQYRRWSWDDGNPACDTNTTELFDGIEECRENMWIEEVYPPFNMSMPDGEQLVQEVDIDYHGMINEGNFLEVQGDQIVIHDLNDTPRFTIEGDSWVVGTELYKEVFNPSRDAVQDFSCHQ